MVYKGVDPDYNPTGVYRTTVTLPADWFASLDGHDLYLRVGAVTSAMYVYVNGQEVGYSQVRRAPNCQAADPKRNTKASPCTRLNSIWEPRTIVLAGLQTSRRVRCHRASG